MAKAQPDSRLDPRFLSAPAALMAEEGDRAIFRRFDEINLLNLLILQDEVQKLTNQLKQLSPHTQTADDGNKAPNAWHMLAHPLATNNTPTPQNPGARGSGSKTKRSVEEFEEKLKEYSEPRKSYPPGPLSQDAQ
jgi:hypothetical protein